MCRWVAVLSEQVVLLADFLLRPALSLVMQSYAAQQRRALPAGQLPNMACKQACLNADGFGIGWYPPHGAGDDTTPHVFTSRNPAWNDPNIGNLSEAVQTRTFVAHVRAAGPSLPISEFTCHPFKAGRLLFAHNGMVGDLGRVRRPLLAGLTDYAFDVAVRHQGIDSAVAFGVFLTALGITSEDDALRERRADEICGALHRTIFQLVDAVAGREESILNFVVGDGQRIVASRYATAPSFDESDEKTTPVGATLYLNVGSRWVASPEDPQTYRMERGAGTAIIASEPLTPNSEEWEPIRPNSMVVCDYRGGEARSIDVQMLPLARGAPSLPIAAEGRDEAVEQRSELADEVAATDKARFEASSEWPDAGAPAGSLDDDALEVPSSRAAVVAAATEKKGYDPSDIWTPLLLPIVGRHAQAVLETPGEDDAATPSTRPSSSSRSSPSSSLAP